MSVHTIRLAGPWELHQAGSEATRVKLPFEFPEPSDSCRLVRKFHRPSGLTDDCDVRIVLQVSRQLITIMVNDQELQPSVTGEDPCSYDVTALLQPFNSLSLQVAENTAAAVVVQAAAMEIHDA